MVLQAIKTKQKHQMSALSAVSKAECERSSRKEIVYDQAQEKQF